MKTSEALKLTLAHLWDGGYNYRGEGYICLAAVEAGVGSVVKPIIAKLLGRHATFTAWLLKRGINPWRNSRKLQATRKAWLQHLIKHYKSIGD